MTNVVLTAGPSAGKSSVIRELAARGFNIVPEAARIIADQRISEGVPEHKVKEDCDFPKRCLTKDRRMESRLKSGINFLDRAAGDSLAYCDLYGYSYDTADELWVKDAYDKVLLLDRINYENDYIRDEDKEEAAAIHDKLESKYRELGYDPEPIPVMPVDERADLILKKTL